jgi:(S)-2-hydroxyglutarate dehydrogenase
VGEGQGSLESVAVGLCAQALFPCSAFAAVLIISKPDEQEAFAVPAPQLPLDTVMAWADGVQASSNPCRVPETVTTHDYLIIGGGIVGLSTAMHLTRSYPGSKILVLEKEASAALHQTGRNSGVIHSGIYYKPGSYKALFAKAGAESMVAFCRDHGIPFDVCGKLIVATDASQLAGLEALYQRGVQNGVPVEKISTEHAREIEPHVNCVAALQVKSTGITSYGEICLEYLRQIEAAGGEVVYRSQVSAIRSTDAGHVVETSTGPYSGRFVINCAGLYSDRVARSAGINPPALIVPFRGEYYELIPERRHLVRTLIYPVPNPDFPFLGVHFTRMIDGGVHAGPNAVLAYAREGYRKRDINVSDLMETLTYRGFWKMASRNLGEGLKEMHRSLSKSVFTRSLQHLIPEVRAEDLRPCAAGIRAQALFPDGKLADDFLIVPGRQILHVCNAPSPAATASLEIGRELAAQVPDLRPIQVSMAADNHNQPKGT